MVGTAGVVVEVAVETVGAVVGVVVEIAVVGEVVVGVAVVVTDVAVATEVAEMVALAVVVTSTAVAAEVRIQTLCKSHIKICSVMSNKHILRGHIATLVGPVVELFRLLTFSALNSSSSHHCGFEPSSSHKTSQVLLAGGQVDFIGDLPFSPHLTIDSAQNE